MGSNWQVNSGQTKYIPLTTNGGTIPDTINTVAHVTWNGTNLVDSFGNSWTQNGTVPQVTTSPLLPAGGSNQKPGAGPFSGSNYYSLPSGSVLNFTSSFCCAIVFNPTMADITGNTVLFSNGEYNSDGWFIEMTDDGGVTLTLSDAEQTNASLAVANGLNVMVAGFDSTSGTVYVQVNGGSLVTSSGHSLISSAVQAFLGAYNGGSLLFSGVIYEFWASTDVPTATLLASISNQIFGQITAEGQILTATRSTSNASYSSNGIVYYASENTLRITDQGALLEPTSTNVLLDSQSFANATWPTANTVSDNIVVAPDGTITGAELISGGGGIPIAQTITGNSSTNLTFSIWLRADTTSTQPALTIYDETSSTFIALEFFTVTSEWQRFIISGTATPGDTIQVQIYPEATNTINMWGAQLEILPFATSYIPTTSSTVTRSPDSLTTLPSFVGLTGSFSCDVQQISDSANLQISSAGGIFDTTNVLSNFSLKVYFYGNTLVAGLVGGDDSNIATFSAPSGHSSTFHHIGVSWISDGATTTTFNLYYDYILESSATSPNAIVIGTPTIGIANINGTNYPLGGNIKNVKIAKDLNSGL